VLLSVSDNVVERVSSEGSSDLSKKGSGGEKLTT